MCSQKYGGAWPYSMLHYQKLLQHGTYKTLSSTFSKKIKIKVFKHGIFNEKEAE